MRELDQTTAPEVYEPESCRPVSSVKHKRFMHAVEARYIGPHMAFSRRRDWSVWKKYETLKRAQQAYVQLTRTKGVLFGQPFYEFRVVELSTRCG